MTITSARTSAGIGRSTLHYTDDWALPPIMQNVETPFCKVPKSPKLKSL